MKCYLKCYSPVNIQIVDQNEQLTTPIVYNQNPSKSTSRTKRHGYSLYIRSSNRSKSPTKLRAQSNPMIPTTVNQHQNSLTNSEHFSTWLKVTNSFSNDNSKEILDMDFV